MNIEPIPWLSSTKWVLPSIIILEVWKNTGFAMLVFLAGLQNISPEYYESAQLDGANRWQLFRHITLPLITPTLFFNLIIYMKSKSTAANKQPYTTRILRRRHNL